MTLEEYLGKHYRNKGLPSIIRRYRKYQNGQELPATQSEVLDYIELLRKKGLHPKSLRNHLHAIKVYYNYLEETGQITIHPCKKLYLKDRIDKSIAVEKLYTAKRLEELFENHKPKDKRLITRNKVIISLLINQALQVSEITSLKTNDINLNKGEIHIEKQAKSNERTLPLKSNQILLLYNYLNDRTALLNHNQRQTDIFIISKFGKELHPHGISKLLNEGKSEKDKIHPLKIRQSVIANLLKQNNDLRTVQVFSGHKRSTSTENYKRSEFEALQAAIDKYHPLQMKIKK